MNVNTLGLFIALGVPSGSSVNWFLGPEASEGGMLTRDRWEGRLTSALFSLCHLPAPISDRWLLEDG